MKKIGRKKPKHDIYETYREVLKDPNLTNAEIEEMRGPVIQIARTICEHVWGEKFY